MVQGKIIDKQGVTLECPKCGCKWSPNLKEGGKCQAWFGFN